MHAGQVADSVNEQIYSNVSGLADVVLTTVNKLGELRIWDLRNYQYLVNYKDSDEYLYNRNPKLYTCYHGNPIRGCG